MRKREVFEYDNVLHHTACALWRLAWWHPYCKTRNFWLKVIILYMYWKSLLYETIKRGAKWKLSPHLPKKESNVWGFQRIPYQIQINREALTVLCSVVKHWETARALKKLGQTFEHSSCFPLYFFRSLAATCVLYNRTEHNQGFFIYYWNTLGVDAYFRF